MVENCNDDARWKKYYWWVFDWFEKSTSQKLSHAAGVGRDLHLLRDTYSNNTDITTPHYFVLYLFDILGRRDWCCQCVFVRPLDAYSNNTDITTPHYFVLCLFDILGRRDWCCQCVFVRPLDAYSNNTDITTPHYFALYLLDILGRRDWCCQCVFCSSARRVLQ